MLSTFTQPRRATFARRARAGAALLCLCALLSLACADAASEAVPDLGPNIRNVRGPAVNDDPDEAWGEWGETAQSKKNPMPQRQRGIQEGMDIHTIMGQAMRQEKVFFAYLRADAAPTAAIGRQINSRYSNLMTAGGVACKVWYVHAAGKTQRQIVLKCDTIRDAHMGKGFLLQMPEIEKVVLDNLAFTPPPEPLDDDDDEDVQTVSGITGMGAGSASAKGSETAVSGEGEKDDL